MVVNCTVKREILVTIQGFTPAIEDLFLSPPVFILLCPPQMKSLGNVMNAVYPVLKPGVVQKSSITSFHYFKRKILVNKFGIEQ